METKCTVKDDGCIVTAELTDGRGNRVTRCKLTLDADAKTWTVSAWYTEKDRMGQGHGTNVLKTALRHCLRRYGRPKAIRYIWNGEHGYVLAWLKRNFDAKCDCPLAVQKNQPDDDWSSHEYSLNVEKTMSFLQR